MIIKTLEQMESIVSNNKTLFWDGWTVVSSYPSTKAKTSKYGAYYNGEWHIQRKFEPGREGWDIPDKMVK